MQDPAELELRKMLLHEVAKKRAIEHAKKRGRAVTEDDLIREVRKAAEQERRNKWSLLRP